MKYEHPIVDHRALHRDCAKRHPAERFCKIGFHVLCGFFVALLVVLGNFQVVSAQDDVTPLINDNTFSGGFEVLAPVGGAVQGTLPAAGTPAWQLGQWNSQSTIFGTAPTLLPSGATRYANADKEIIFGGGSSAGESDLILSVDGNNEFGGVYRTSADPWPALLASQRISNPGGQLSTNTPSIADMTGLDLNIDAKLLFDNRNIGPGYDSTIHSSQFNLFHTIQNLNPNSSGFGDFLWFGTSIYDDRTPVTSLFVAPDAATGKLIYSTGIAPYTSDVVANGNWVNISGDILPNIKLGLQEAWNQGFLTDSQNFADYHIGGMNMGWEVTGLNNASMQIRNYSLTARTAHVNQFRDDANTRALWHMEADEATFGQTPRIDDDNSTGRTEYDLKFTGPDSFPNTHPSIVPGSSNGSNALSFDGVDDVAKALGAWQGATDNLTTISLDALVRPQDFPSDSLNLMHVVGAVDWRLWWRQIGPAENNTGRFDFWINTPGIGNGFTKVAGQNVALDAWHDVHAELDANGNISLIVDGVTNTAALDPSFPMKQTNSQVQLGLDLFNAAGREFAGLIDEVRVGTLPALPGDFDGDGDVDGADFLFWQRGVGTTFDANDLADWENNFGATAAPALSTATAIPEPTSWSLLLLAVAIVVHASFRATFPSTR